MKHFTIVGPKTTSEFDIEDDEMIEWRVRSIKDFEAGKKGLELQNEITYDTTIITGANNE